MMVNTARGEVEVTLGGERRVLCLTLGALAAMEGALGVSGFTGLAERLKRLSAGDLAVVLRALGVEPEGVGPREAAEAVAAVFRAASGEW